MGYGKNRVVKYLSVKSKNGMSVNINMFLSFQGENPIFKQATSTFKNPTYAGK